MLEPTTLMATDLITVIYKVTQVTTSPCTKDLEVLITEFLDWSRVGWVEMELYQSAPDLPESPQGSLSSSATALTQ